jgi:hypothetical protein
MVTRLPSLKPSRMKNLLTAGDIANFVFAYSKQKKKYSRELYLRKTG